MHASILNPKDPEWKVTFKDVKKALRLAGSSSPGPDGIPFLAYNKLGVLSQTILFHAIRQLSTPDAEGGLHEACATDEDARAFNEALMVFLPKNTSFSREGQEIYEPGNTRPLTIVN